MSENKKKGDFNKSDLSSALPSTGLNAEDIMGLVIDQRKLQNLAAVMEKLAPEVKKRVEFLRNIQIQYDEFESKFHEERAALEAKYQKIYEPLYTMRYEIVNGLVEVEGVVDDSMEDIAAEDKANEGNKGVPGFWLTAMKANEDLIEEIEINEQDEDALKHLKDIKCSKIDGDQRGFKLEFFFSPNPYFKNFVLSKTYLMFDDDDGDEPILKKAIGSEIEWFPGKCLTQKVIMKKPKKGLKNAKLITKTEICSSFFNFFSPPNVPEENDVDFDEETDEQLDDQLEQDYEVGTIIRDKIIPHAVSWFTGEAEELEDIEGDEDDDDEDDSEEDEEGEEEDDDEEGKEEDDDADEDVEKEAKKRKFATGLKEPGECKQAVVSEGLCLAAWIM